jgi:hypothetical protein
MDNTANGNQSLVLCILLGIVNWFTADNIDTTIKLISGLGSIVAAFMAARYYYYATKEKKNNVGK